jgi:hypothetical protein
MNLARTASPTVGRQEIVRGLGQTATGIEQSVENDEPTFYWSPPERPQPEVVMDEESPTTTATTNVQRRPEPFLVRTPQVELVARQLEVLQRFEGTVRSVHEDTGEMVVELRDLTHLDAPREEATIGLSDVSDPDLELVAPGAVFYWTIGYEVRKGTQQKTRISELRFRRHPTWTRRELVEIQRKADALSTFFGSAG